MEKSTEIEYNDLSQPLAEEIKKFIAEGKTVEAFLKERYNINSLSELDFTLNSKDIDDFSFQKVRGNINLMMGNIRTQKESDALIEEVLGYDLLSLASYKP